MRTIEIRTSTQVYDALERLVATGYFGKTVAEAADQLLRERIRELSVIRAKEAK